MLSQSRRSLSRVGRMVMWGTLLALSACGQPRWAGSPPCSLLTTNEVASAFGTPMSSARPQTDNPNYTICSYAPGQVTDSRPSPLIILQINRQAVNVATVQQRFNDAKLAIEAVPDLGDTAFFVADNAAAAPTLFVFKGDQMFSIAIVDSPQDVATTRRTLHTLAQTALARLPT